MTKKVSVIVPVYNTGKLLKKCIDSILDQSYNDVEIICIDDCSSDESPEILEEYAKVNKNFIVMYNSENIGQGRSRMKGISLAKGEYIFFVDSDDYIDRDYISTYLETVVHNDYDVVVGGFIRDEGSRKYINRANSNIGSIISYSHACCKMYKKQFIVDNHISFGDFRKGEDIYFSLMLVMNKASHGFIDYSGYYYYMNNNSTTRTMDYTTNFERVVYNMFDKIIEDTGDLGTKEQRYLEYAYVASMTNALLMYNRGCPRDVYMDKCKLFLEGLSTKFKNYKTNKLLFRWQKTGPSLKCRLGVWVMMNAVKYKMEKQLFSMIWFFAIRN